MSDSKVMLEKQIEKKVCDYAKSKGVIPYKFTSPNRAAVPDRLFVAPDNKIWFCEFKRTGQKPTPAQVREITRLQNQGCFVFVVDNVLEGITMVDLMVGGV